MKIQKYKDPVIITDRKMVEALASDLMEMHRDKTLGLSLDQWPAAREFVTRFYRPPEEE